MRARFPTDLDRPDRILAGLTARQVGILGSGGLLMWLTFMSLADSLSIAGAAAICAPIGTVAAVVSANAPDGTPMEKFLLRGLRYLVHPRRLVLAPAGLPERSRLRKRLAVVGLPVRGVSADGFIDLGKLGTAALCRASAVHYHLRSVGERMALARAMGRAFNSLEGPVQILVVSHPIDAEALVSDLEEGASYLPHPRLTEACRQYAGFFRSLVEGGDVLGHEVFVALREHGSPSETKTALVRRTEELATQLREMGVRLDRLGGMDCEAALIRAADPGSGAPREWALSSKPVGGAS